MAPFEFNHPLCLSCGISLKERLITEGLTKASYQVQYCPNCQEIYTQTKIST